MIVLVPTCDRPSLFARLVRQLARDLGPQDRIIAHDDASAGFYVDKVFSSSELCCPFTAIRSFPRVGIRGYWCTVERLLTAAGQAGTDPNEPILYLADDFVMAPDWFERSMALLDCQAPPSQLGVPRVRCLGVAMHTDYRICEWGLSCKPCDRDGERVAWMDGMFLTRRIWIPFLIPGRIDRDWDRFPLCGSGVWAKTSLRTHTLGLWWYRPYVSLSRHDDGGISMMNPLWNGPRPLMRTRGLKYWRHDL